MLTITLRIMAKMFRKLVLFLTIVAQVSPAEDIHKVALTYQGRQDTHGLAVYVFTVGQDRNILFGLAPLDQEPLLSPGDILVCQEFTQSIGVRTVNGKELGDFREIGFICGGKRYLFTHLSIRGTG
jgi:urease accessory protein UreE